MSTALLDQRSKELRLRVVQVLERGGRGHVGSSLSPIEILRVLFDDVLRFDARNPAWPKRDRFILSKGHGCIPLYVLLQEKGYFAEEELWKFCRFDGILGGHPDPKVPGIEVSTGSLGHGLAIAVGMAVAAQILGADHRVFVLVGDGECNEGSIWEAALAATKHNLDNMTVIVDYNKLQSYGSTQEVLNLDPLAAKWDAFGFTTREVDGHDVAALRQTLRAAPFAPGKPSAIIANTVKGRGVSFAEFDPMWHHKNSFKSGDIDRVIDAIHSTQ
ncbi:MAG: transketolase [Chloroflexi bacterium]|nr:transketolase [Chloroflexota bacterium]